MPVPKSRRRIAYTYGALLCSHPGIQAVLPHFLVCSEKRLPKTVAKGFAALPPTRLRLLRRKYSWVTTDFMIRILADVREALQPWLRMVKPILVLDTASPYLQHTVTMLVRQHCWQPIVEGRNISQQSVADNQYFWYCCILLLRQRCWLPILKHFCKWELPKALRKISVVKILQKKLSWAPRQLWQDVACASW